MSPEYAIDGLFSVKSDVFSFGVLVLEIVSGKRNRRFSHPDHKLNLLGHVRAIELLMKFLLTLFIRIDLCYGLDKNDTGSSNDLQAWRLSREMKSHELIEESIRESCNEAEMLRSVHVALLCVQQSPDDRPSMSRVVLMLSSDISLPQPKEPGFFNERDLSDTEYTSTKNEISTSDNAITVTVLEGR